MTRLVLHPFAFVLSLRALGHPASATTITMTWIDTSGGGCVSQHAVVTRARWETRTGVAAGVYERVRARGSERPASVRSDAGPGETDVSTSGPVANPAPAPNVRHIPAWWLYTLSLATLGIYLVVWIYRTARDTGAAGSQRRTPVWWALGSFCFPVCVAILYEFARHAGRIRGRPSGAGVWLGPLLYAAIVGFATLSPWRSLLAPALLLAPLPFVVVQRQLERAASQAHAGEASTALPKHALDWALLAVGLPAVAALIWWTDSSALRDLARPRLEAGEIVKGRELSYTLEVPRDGWKRVESGQFGDEGSDLELAGPSGGSWVVTYVHAGMGIDDIVDSRRSVLRETLGGLSFEERRSFLSQSDFVSFSQATYRGFIAGLGETLYVVSTVSGDDRSVEVIAFSPDPPNDESDLKQLIASIAFPEGAP